MPSSNLNFLARNFTDAEIAYCQAQPNPPASFAGRWVGKEAVFKSLGINGKGAGAPLKEIEIVNNEKGAPIVYVSPFITTTSNMLTVQLHGDAAEEAKKAGVKEVQVSISHSDSQAIAIAISSF